MFVRKRFYTIFAGIILCFIVGCAHTFIFSLAQLLLLLFIAVCLYDIFMLFITAKKGIEATRECNERFSNGDENEIRIHISNRYSFAVTLEIIDEIPDIFQYRDVLFTLKMDRKENKTLRYSLRPVQRGVYSFGEINVFAGTRIGLIARRFKLGKPENVKVYPSYVHLKRYELMTASSKLTHPGQKKIRKIGQQLEPDQIKEYIKGDDYRFINWKATARRSKLMANVFQDERAQNVYCLIDKGRTMQSAFNGMTLLDYAINASLALSYVAMLKGDKAGLMTFERKFETFIPPSRTPVQMNHLMEALYAQQTSFLESDFSLLNHQVNKDVKNRGLLLIFTNFDSERAMQRQLRYLSLLAKRHTIVVIFFQNTELEEIVEKTPVTKEEIYESVIAEKLDYEKKLIIRKLRQYNILSLLTHPDNLTVNIINQYLDIKARGNW